MKTYREILENTGVKKISDQILFKIDGNPMQVNESNLDMYKKKLKSSGKIRLKHSNRGWVFMYDITFKEDKEAKDFGIKTGALDKDVAKLFSNKKLYWMRVG